MADDRDQLRTWKAAFGDDYTDRNVVSEERVRERVNAFATVLAYIPTTRLKKILEVGCNVGINLRALSRLTNAELHAVEPNDKARRIAIETGAVSPDRLHDASIEALGFDDGACDLVFTSGVLIHIPPEKLEAAYREMYRVAGRWLLSIEYFSRQPEIITYRGLSNMLFKRDYGRLWLDLYPDLEPVAQGFFWKHSTGLDDLTWWLFRKI